jgi:hypothetical protein
VLAFLAYILISTSAVVLGSKVSVNEASGWIPLVSEDWARIGIILVGVPLLVFRFIPRLWVWPVREPHPPQPDGPGRLLPIIAFGIAFLFVILSTIRPAPPGWKSVEDPARGFAVRLPPNWTTERLANGTLALRAEDPRTLDAAIPTQMIVGVEPAQSGSLDGIERMLREKSPNLQLYRTKFPAGTVQVVAASVIANGPDAKETALESFVFLLGGEQFIVQFSTDPARYGREQTLFYAIAKTFHFA